MRWVNGVCKDKLRPTFFLLVGVGLCCEVSCVGVVVVVGGDSVVFFDVVQVLVASLLLRRHLGWMIKIFFYRQLDFSSELGVANDILENEPKSFLTVA